MALKTLRLRATDASWLFFGESAVAASGMKTAAAAAAGRRRLIREIFIFLFNIAGAFSPLFNRGIVDSEMKSAALFPFTRLAHDEIGHIDYIAQLTKFPARFADFE